MKGPITTRILGTKDIARVVYATISADNNVRRRKPLPSFEDLDKTGPDYYINMVKHLLGNPRQSYKDLHEKWYWGMVDEGWKRGPYCVSAKTHPDLKPYSELPHGIRLKHALAHSIVLTYLDTK